MLGIKRVMVVHGADGLDEISVTGPTRVVSIDESDRLRDEMIDPSVFGIEPYHVDELKGGSPSENAGIARSLIEGEGPAAVWDAVAANTGAALYVAGLADSLKAGYETANEALASGAVGRKLEQVAARSRELAEEAL